MAKIPSKAARDNRVDQLNPCNSRYFRARGASEKEAAFSRGNR